jgi:hypothetical protein
VLSTLSNVLRTALQCRSDKHIFKRAITLFLFPQSSVSWVFVCNVVAKMKVVEFDPGVVFSVQRKIKKLKKFNMASLGTKNTEKTKTEV